jgi:fatty acid desaturase
MAGTMMNGIIVTIGEGWGKIRGSDAFQNKKRLLAFFVIEILLIAGTLEFIASFLQSLLLSYIQFIPALVVQFIVIFYLWFNHSFDFDPNWLTVGIIEVLFVILLSLGYYGI